LITNGLLGKFVTKIANREAVGNNRRALTKDDIIQGARAFPDRVSSPLEIESCFQSRKVQTIFGGKPKT
jgi:hypothetical protein